MCLLKKGGEYINKMCVDLKKKLIMNKIVFILFCVILITDNSCLHRQFVEGRFEIKSISDTLLNDSSFVFGHIHNVDWSEKETYFENEFEIWIENSDLKTTNNITGYYSIKTKPGTYTIKCQSSFNEWERLVEKTNIELQKNKKIEIDFYIGYTIE